MAALPAPKNGQVRAVPDERTIRYYGTIGLLDRPIAMRGRTALYGRRHLAQVVAIKRLQTTGSSLADIQALWPSLDDATLSRMAGVALTAAAPSPPPPPSPRPARADFWRAAPGELAAPESVEPPAAPPVEPLEIQIELAPGIRVAIAVPGGGLTLTQDDVRALRASAGPLIELTRRRFDLTDHGTPPEHTNEGESR
ncbi:MAG: MerR family transcriptional regulator [Deltaproteobacteria bacterium]|nr:MerR family transcriptional regulator [Deltaproteobacteria bacterium]